MAQSAMKELPKRLLPFFWYFVRQQPLSFAIFYLAPIAEVLESTLIPYSIKLLIDALVSYSGERSQALSALAHPLWLYSASLLGMIIIFRLQNWLQAYALPRFQSNIRMTVMDYLLSHSHRYFTNHFAGSLANKVSDLPRSLDGIHQTICWSVITSIAVSLGTLILMSTISVVCATILGLWGIIHLSIVIFFSRKTGALAKTNAEDKSILSGTIVDSLSNMLSVKLFARKKHELHYIGQKQTTEQKSNKSLMLATNLLRFWMDIFVTLMLGGLLYGVIWGWQHGAVSAGDIAFVLLGSTGIMNQMWSLGNVIPDLFRNIGVARQALSLLSIPHEITDLPDAKPLQIKRGEIAFESVSFRYHGTPHIFQDKEVLIEAGSKVGLVGFSGSGKTTFVQLILRLYDIESGKIVIDNQDIKTVTEDSLHASIAMIPQDTALFHRTLLENIRYGRLDATDQEVMIAAQQAYCEEFIQALPDGYQSLVGERGIKLSGGQRQRIAIARALLKDAPILILDEATSALDSVTEKYIQASLNLLMQGRTTIIIAHRLSTLSEMDRILVFDRGRIVESGHHKQLLEMNGHYAKMWAMQAGGFLPDRDL